MNARPVLSPSRHPLIAGAFVLIIAPASLAADPAPALRVAVFPDYYAVSEARVVDLVGLEAAIAPAPGRVLRLDGCGPASAPALLAAVERFHLAHAGVIEIRALEAGEPACRDVAGGAGLAADDGLSDRSSHLATDRSGRSVLP